MPQRRIDEVDPFASMVVFVDFDGTITDVDTFDALVRDAVGDAFWDVVDAELAAGQRTLRQVLTLQASHIRKTEAEALAFVSASSTVDPAFAPFVEVARERGIPVSVLSSGVAAIIRRTLERAGVSVPVVANSVQFDSTGWTIEFVDDSANGHDKAAAVREARLGGAYTVFIGDGVSDFSAAHEADRCFSKVGRALERYCQTNAIPSTSFSSFSEIAAALFADSAAPEPNAGANALR